MMASVASEGRLLAINDRDRAIAKICELIINCDPPSDRLSPSVLGFSDRRIAHACTAPLRLWPRGNSMRRFELLVLQRR
jgi:hypothetical protein